MQRAFISLLPLATLSCLIPFAAQAQVTPDGTTSTTVNQDGNNFTINQGNRVGDNLFHSFNEFSVPTLGSAVFNNAGDIANIFSRVTGSNISNIDGLIGANGAANLFLINPNGIIFGQNASLNLGGSFFASTADSLLFEGDAEFSAVNPQAPPLLEVSIPIGASFRDNPGDIVNNSAGNGLQVSAGKTIALIGGNVTFDGGNIIAPSANVEIGGLTASGTVNLSESGSLTFPDGVARGDVSLANGSIVNVAGNGGGSIFINARNFSLAVPGEIIAGIAENSGSPTAQAGDIIIDATENFVINGEVTGEPISGVTVARIINSVFPGGAGNTGNLEISAQNISLINFGLIRGENNTGDIILTATENITFDNGQIFNNINSNDAGQIGNINLTAQNLFLRDFAQISNNVSGTGNSGDININVLDTVSVNGTDSLIENGSFGGRGNTGNININAKNLVLTNTNSSFGGIRTEYFDGEGNAGDINITANNISLDSGDISTEFDGFEEEVGQSTAGNINIQTDSLSLINESQLSASTSNNTIAGNININATNNISIDSGSAINASVLETPAIGNAGNIEINTSNLDVTNGGQISAFTVGQGDAGSVFINATDSVNLSGSLSDRKSAIATSVNETAIGNAGDLTIQTKVLNISDDAQIAVDTFGQGNAGNLTISATEQINLSGENSFISASVLEGATGNGGTINIIDTGNIAIFDGGEIAIESLGNGEAGDLNITAKSLNLANDANLDAATPLGEGGNINLKVAEDIILQNNSFISAQALDNANGGNVTINADNGVILAFPNQNNDIFANASQGNGGNIDITTQAIFGLEERLSTPPNTTNDIDASSEFGLQGDFSLNTPDVDPTSGLIQLPASVGDASDQISQNPCEQGIGSQFIITGKGGFPANPHETLNSDEVRVGLVEPVAAERGGDEATGRQENVGAQGLRPMDGMRPEKENNNSIPEEIVPAMGWIFNDKGQVTLTSYDPTGTGKQRSWESPKSCPAR